MNWAEYYLDMISMIAATDINGIIGNKSGVPWGRSQLHDLQRFRKLTENHVIIVGRKTFEEFDAPLITRQHIVVTSTKTVSQPEVTYMNITEAINFATKHTDEVFIIGGQQTFESFLPIADKIYLTVIDASYDGDRYFPALDESWAQDARECFKADEVNLNDYCFIDYKRLS